MYSLFNARSLWLVLRTLFFLSAIGFSGNIFAQDLNVEAAKRQWEVAKSRVDEAAQELRAEERRYRPFVNRHQQELLKRYVT